MSIEGIDYEREDSFERELATITAERDALSGQVKRQALRCERLASERDEWCRVVREQLVELQNHERREKELREQLSNLWATHLQMKGQVHTQAREIAELKQLVETVSEERHQLRQAVSTVCNCQLIGGAK